MLNITIIYNVFQLLYYWVYKLGIVVLLVTLIFRENTLLHTCR